MQKLPHHSFSSQPSAASSSQPLHPQQQQQQLHQQQQHQHLQGTNNDGSNINTTFDSLPSSSLSGSSSPHSQQHHHQQQQSNNKSSKDSKTKRKTKSLPNSCTLAGDFDQSPSDDKRKRESSASPSPSSADSEEAKSKKQRLSWTNELHASFVEAVSVLGIDNAAPKAIKNLMGVSHVTTDHIKSHLQKYRLQIKKGDEQLPPPKESKDITPPPPPQEVATVSVKPEKKKKKKKSAEKSSPVPPEEKVETISVKNVETSENKEVKANVQTISSDSLEQISNSRSNSLGFNNWMHNSHSNSIPSIFDIHHHSEKETESHILLDNGMNNDASNSNFSFLKKGFLENTNSGSFLFDNSQSGFLMPSLSNLGDEPTSNHLPVFVERENTKEERNTQHPSSSVGFNINTNSKSSFLSENTCQNPNEPCISFTSSSLQQYSSMLAEMCRTDEDIRQMFLDAKNLIKADDHFLLLLLGYRLGVLSEKRSKK